MDTKTKLSDKLDNMIGNFAEGNMPDHAFLTALRECVTEAERLDASPPTLNIGMGEEEIEAKAKEYSAELRSMLRHLGEQESTRHGSTAFFAYDSALRFANAYTKAVTMEAIVAECENQIEDDVEGWRSYDWEVFKKQLTARLLKLTQQP